jgi:hypothetical protein
MNPPDAMTAFSWPAEGNGANEDRAGVSAAWAPRLARLSQDAEQAGFPVAADHLAYLASVVSHQIAGKRT